MTIIFNDVYAGRTEMKIEGFRTSVRGQRVTRFRFSSVNSGSCVTTGFRSCGFPSVETAIAAAQRHASFEVAL